MSFLQLTNIDVSYDGKKKILEKLNLDIEKGRLVSLLGPSGCGKTTTLRVIAGFIQPNAGRFTLDGSDYTNIPIHKRSFGIVFQSYALFPHLSVVENVAFGLQMRRISKADAKKRAADILETVDMAEYSNRFPKDLSGGQRQRVALARALVIEPSLLLLDEPLSNLDAKLRLKMRMEIRELQQTLKITTVFVTHDQEECFSISDQVAVMNGGVIEQYDTPEAIYNRPATEFVARFVGFENFLSLNHSPEGLRAGSVLFPSLFGDENTSCLLGAIRPDDIRIESADKKNTLGGRVLVRTYLGKGYQYKVETDLGTLLVNGSGEQPYQSGDSVRLCLPSDKLVVV